MHCTNRGRAAIHGTQQVAVQNCLVVALPERKLHRRRQARVIDPHIYAPHARCRRRRQGVHGDTIAHIACVRKHAPCMLDLQLRLRLPARFCVT